MLFFAIAGGSMFFLALLLCDLFPPPSPGNSAAFWVSFWSTDIQLKRVGLICGLLAPMGLITLYVVIFQQLRRIEDNEALACTQFGAGVLALVPGIIIPFLVWSPLVYRPDTLEPHLTQTLTDLGMFSFFVPWPAIIQMVAFAFAVFRDHEQKVFPRWFGYLNLWVALIAIPGGTLYFFKNGPMAWNGLLPWWVALVGAGVWGVPVFILLFRAIGQQLGQEAAGPAEGVETRGAAIDRST